MEWKWLGYTNLCTIEIPDDAQTVKFSHKYRSDKVIILDTPVPFKEHKMWSDIESCKLIVKRKSTCLTICKGTNR
uniref:Uncharacterized protein n=1 Tax=viral metagenome TaxID=1070528 RepID=A0A6C0J4A5_9ZZZZ